MTGYEYTLTNRVGQSVKFNDFTTDPDNFIALQDYPVFDVDVKNQEIDREGQHGIWDFFSFYGKRVITFSGVIIGESEGDVETLKRQLLQVISLPSQPSAENDGMVLIQWTDANGSDWQIYAKLERPIRFDRPLKRNLQLGFVITMKAPSPEIESQEVITNEGMRGWQTGSLRLSTLLPAKINLIWQNAEIATNNGTVEAHTIIRLHGEAGGVANPRIYNFTTGKTFQVNMNLADQTKWIEIDSKAGTVVDQDGNDQSGNVDPMSEYVLLAIGDNELVYLSDESSGADSPVNTWKYPAAEFSVAHRSTIL